MKKIQKLIRLTIFGLAAILLPTMTGCNSSSSGNEDIYYTLSTNVGVTDFTLKADSKVMTNLDSVFFSIDLERRVIFNADSLPKGTKITGLIPVISYPQTATKVEITQQGGSRDGTINYMTNPNDSVDFTGNVTLSITAQDGVTERSYRLKVNVHQSIPDSLIWDQVALSSLPSRLSNPVEQKTVSRGKEISCLLKESDGTYTLSSNSSIFDKSWTKNALSLPFTPQVRTFTASADAFFLLSDSGELFTSPDGFRWNSTGRSWRNIIGDYQGRLLGIRYADGVLTHTEYPGTREIAADPSFPVEGYSNFAISSNKWTSTPSAMISGGRLADGSLTSFTWGFDGSGWAHIDNGKLPPILSPTIVPYYSFRQTTSSWILNREYNIWLCFGGQLEDGSFNKTSYVSYDSGVTWVLSKEMMDLPDFLPGMAFADGIIVTAPYTANLSSEWTKTRISYEINGTEITWDCPFIYLFGGRDGSGSLCDTIWRGVLARLTFTPVI